MHRQNKKLQLHKTTLRVLHQGELQTVRGGIDPGAADPGTATQMTTVSDPPTMSC